MFCVAVVLNLILNYLDSKDTNFCCTKVSIDLTFNCIEVSAHCTFIFFLFRVTKDHFVFHGINTELFQCGTELKSKTPINMPWKFTVKMNVKQRKFEIDFNPVKKVTELFAVK